MVLITLLPEMQKMLKWLNVLLLMQILLTEKWRNLKTGCSSHQIMMNKFIVCSNTFNLLKRELKYLKKNFQNYKHEPTRNNCYRLKEISNRKLHGIIEKSALCKPQEILKTTIKTTAKWN